MTARIPAGLVAALAGGAAAGQFNDAPRKPAAVPAPVLQNAWPDEQFERWAFSTMNATDSPRKRFETLLSLQVGEIDRACRLTDPQKQKLRLMGSGDIKRVYDAYDAALREFNRLGNDVQQLQQVMPLVAPVQAAGQAGPFQADSLFTKSLRHTLTPEQYEHYRALDRERRTFLHRAQIDMAVQVLEEMAPLRDAQRRELTELLLRETKPLRSPGRYGFYVVMYQLGQVPEGKLKPLFTDLQWKGISRLVDQYRQIMPALRGQGVVFDEDEDDAPAAGK